MIRSKNLIRSGGEYNCIYRNMRGVDFSGDGSAISSDRFAYAENVYRDYDGDGADVIESVPGFRRIAKLSGRIHRIACFRGADGEEYAVVHAGAAVYRFAVSDRDELGELTPVAEAADAPSASYTFGGALYLLDGSSILRVTESEAEPVDDEHAAPYIPTLYRNGAEYEQRNLLTRRFFELYRLSDAQNFSYGSPGLQYRILDGERKECALTGCDSGVGGAIRIPRAVRIGEDYYTVTDVADFAFYNNAAVTTVTAAEGVRRVGKFAFAGCSALTEVILPDSVTLLDNACFNTCLSLTYIRVGKGLLRIANAAFGATGLQTFAFGGSEEEFAAVENRTAIGSVTILYRVAATAITIELPVCSPASAIDLLTVNGNAFSSYLARTENGRPIALVLSFADRSEIDGAEVIFGGTLANGENASRLAGGFLRANPAFTSDPAGAIRGCRVAEAYDGRIFLAGNPDFPNAVFYSARNGDGENDPLYFGELNYFCDGVGSFPVNAMLAAGSALAVFKAGDDGTGSIFYHTGADTGSDLLPRIYPVAYVHSGLCCSGAAISFFDDPVFVSKSGLSALDKTAIHLERSVVTRSHNVNKYLLSEDLSEVSMAIWCGYLALLTNGNIYLADSRAVFRHETGGNEYEWFFLTGIGCYDDDAPVYRYAAVGAEGYGLSETPDEKVRGTVYSAQTEGGTVYYTKEASPYPLVYRTEEYEGGDFAPACTLCASGDLLFFGTREGHLCLFNNDKRGEAPAEVAADPDFSEAEYREAMGRRVHPVWYDFDRHAPRCLIRTKNDCCGVPHLTKSTVKHSLVVKLRSFRRGKLRCDAVTDRSGFTGIARLPGGAADFSDVDFSSLVLAADETVHFALAEKEKRWVEKQICICSEEFRAPIGVCSISYRFVVAGRIRD